MNPDTITLSETDSDVLVIHDDHEAWELGTTGEYLRGGFAADAQLWIDGDWSPSEEGGQRRTTPDGCNAVATWTPEKGITLLYPAYQIGEQARQYIGVGY